MALTMKENVESILRNWENYEWTIQGFGMLRTYVGSDRKFRVNIWDNRFAVPGVSMIHDHPWDFTSNIIVGSIVNIRYIEVACALRACEYSYAKIKCGPGGGMETCVSDLELHPLPLEYYDEGDTYRQRANEIHETKFMDGTVTLIERTFREDTEHARVFWRRDSNWVSAEPRVATSEEVIMFIDSALARF